MIKEKIIVFIPCKVISEANNSDHWTKKRKRKLVLQWMVRAALLNKYEFPLPCIVTLERIGKRLLDEDNMIHSFKNIRDIIAEIIIEYQDEMKHKIENLPSNSSPKRTKGSHDADPRIMWKYAQKTQKNEFGKKRDQGFYVTIEGIE